MLKGHLIIKNKVALKKRTAWNKGKKMSLEYRTKLSEAHLGQIPWNKGKRYSSVSTREASTCVTRNGFRAQDWKRLVLERDEYTCQECGRTDIDKLHAHHIVPFDENVELRFSLDNGKTLCTTCHNKIHGFREGLPGYWTGKKRSPETIAKMVKGKIGVPLSEEHKQKLKGRTPWNKGTKGKTTAWNKGISHILE